MEQPLKRIVGMNPCADCAYPISLCLWLHEGKEVPGWIAHPCIQPGEVGSTFRILYCPFYIPPKARRHVFLRQKGMLDE